MAKKTFRNKKYTSRVKPITSSQLESLRRTAIKNANPKDYKRIKFLNSAQFDKRIRQNIKENRVTKNIKNIKYIASSIANTKERQKVITKLFGEVHTRNKDKPVRYNSFTTKRQTERLSKIVKQINQGKFKIKRYVSHNQKYKSVKRHLPKGAGIGEILSAMDRTNFYFENRRTILQHNKNVSKHGLMTAKGMSAGSKLSQAYTSDLNDEDLEFLENIKFI